MALVLTLDGARGRYSAILRLTEFARTCRLPDKAAKLQIIEIAHSGRDTARDLRGWVEGGRYINSLPLHSYPPPFWVGDFAEHQNVNFEQHI